MDNDVDTSLVRTAVDLLARTPDVSRNPWGHVNAMMKNRDDEWVAWWWRSVNRIDIPTYHTLRLKVIELRLKQ